MDRAQAGPVRGDVQSVRQFVHGIVGRVFPRYPHGQNHFDPLVSPVAFSQGIPPVRLAILSRPSCGRTLRATLPPDNESQPLQNQSFRERCFGHNRQLFPAIDALNQPDDSFCQRSISRRDTHQSGFWFIFSGQQNPVTDQEHSMKGKIALVTGANGGLGTFVTQALLDAGATVVGLSQRIQQSAFNSPNFTALPADISTAAGVKSALDSLVSRFGQLDILAHTVGGFAGGQSIAAHRRRYFPAHVRCQPVQHLLSSARGGAGHAPDGKRTHRRHRQPRRAGTRSRRWRLQRFQGRDGFIDQDVAQENKDAGMTANAILPGTMDTPANRKFMPDADLSKWVRPAAIASLIVWLAGDAGKDVNGAVIPVYGSEG